MCYNCPGHNPDNPSPKHTASTPSRLWFGWWVCSSLVFSLPCIDVNIQAFQLMTIQLPPGLTPWSVLVGESRCNNPISGASTGKIPTNASFPSTHTDYGWRWCWVWWQQQQQQHRIQQYSGTLLILLTALYHFAEFDDNINSLTWPWWKYVLVI